MVNFLFAVRLCSPDHYLLIFEFLPDIGGINFITGCVKRFVGLHRVVMSGHVAVARKLLINCYVMLRDDISYEQFALGGAKLACARGQER